MNRNSHRQSQPKNSGNVNGQRMSASDALKKLGTTAPPEESSSLQSNVAPSQLLSMLRSGLRPNTYLSALRLSNLSQLLLDDGTERLFHRIGYGVMLAGALLVSGATGLNLPVVQFLEWEVQTFFFQKRGITRPSQEVVILEIDEASLGQSEFYAAAPEDYPFLAPIARWPWQRTAYAIAIDRLLQAGAKTVVIDVVFDLPSTWGEADDVVLQQTLEQYPGQVVLASQFETVTQNTGSMFKFLRPLPRFTDAGALVGYIDYPIEVNGRIHQFSKVWLTQNMAASPIAQHYFSILPPDLRQSLDHQTLRAIRSTESGRGETGDEIPDSIDAAVGNLGIGNQIFFYGPAQTFERQSFWTVLDPQGWRVHRQKQTFHDKVVVIGPTAELFNDFHRTPYGLMPGVEIHANAIANYLENRAIATVIPQPYGRALLVLVITVAAGTAISYPRRMIYRAIITVGALGVWATISYGLWWGANLVLPTALPLGAIAFIGTGYTVSGLVRGKLKLRGLLRRYVSSPIIQDIISQQADLQDLIAEEERATIGKKLQGRYEIIKILAAGGFGQTFTARDLHRPGHPICVVKQLHPVTNDPKVFHLSQRLFQREAEALERLGAHHNQIPQLLAYFEEAQEFYLVQELIEGRPLHHELHIRQPFSNRDLIILLQELLEILVFTHRCNVIHRDIKPSNVIRRYSDQKLVLIDFGAVKEIQGPSVEEKANHTVSIGTRGYMPNEQLAGNPQFNSDIYAVGIIGIQASTKLTPEELRDDVRTGELVWQRRSSHCMELKEILYNMTRYDFRQRYQSVAEVLHDLDKLLTFHPATPNDLSMATTAANSMPQNWPQPSSLVDEVETALANPNDPDNWGRDDDERYSLPTLPWPNAMNSDPVLDDLSETAESDEAPTLAWSSSDVIQESSSAADNQEARESD
ncbi:MAG: CHASE2 domain-containing protein [Cyanothece sp. SIO2G6]|nr:CHASE2 domain-containing protein [Cyanothece sp. SIO2G6]